MKPKHKSLLLGSAAVAVASIAFASVVWGGVMTVAASDGRLTARGRADAVTETGADVVDARAPRAPSPPSPRLSRTKLIVPL